MPPEYTPEFEARVQAWVEARLKPKRIPHVRGVVETADWMAQLYAPTERMRVRLAAWIHDAAKHLPDDELKRLAELHQLLISEGEKAVPMLLHGAVGYLLAAQEFGLDDPQIQSACAFHTTGDPTMTATDMIVYVADLIEPTRDFPGVEELRTEARRSLEGVTLMATDFTLRYLIDRGKYIDPRPVFLHNRLIQAGVRS
ncbi:MAG: bis(5'-nucleosyl)-tetraphosphatase (symmetrical) YqeK [Chloroflexi bacterium]|nr:bis(5'-nucleosyl)-tetraphosphatase (symmetrical) YqeK [Chloroflexota bacterium]